MPTIDFNNENISQKNISPKEIFKNLIKNASSIFRDKKILSDEYFPNEILFRDAQVLDLTKSLSPILIGDSPVNVFVFGFSGTGKTLVTKKVVSDLSEVAKENSINFSYVIMNCRLENINTEYRLITSIDKIFGAKLPDTGLSLSQVYDVFNKILSENNVNKLLIVLDEIDYLIIRDQSFLYNLSRIREKNKNISVSILGISNLLNLKSRIEPKIISSLNPKELVFPPYTAEEIRGILESRAKLAFNEGVIEEGVIPKIAAISAQEHGDARKAINLLRSAGEVAQKQGDSKVTINHVDIAYYESEKNVMEEVVKSLTPQSKLVFLAILNLIKRKGSGQIFSGEVYDEYVRLARQLGYRELTFRRVSDLIYELDYNSLIKMQMKSRGRYGRSREVSLGFSKEVIPRLEEIIKNSLTSNL